MITKSSKILQAARVDDLRTNAESLAAAVSQPSKMILPRSSRSQRRFVLWLLARDRRRSSAIMEFLD